MVSDAFQVRKAPGRPRNRSESGLAGKTEERVPIWRQKGPRRVYNFGRLLRLHILSCVSTVMVDANFVNEFPPGARGS